MTFYEVVDKVVELLRNRGRVSYRALKREFELNDEYLEDLKEELIDTQELAIDKEGKMLVWIGEPSPSAEPHEPTAPTASPAPSTEQPSAPPRQAEPQIPPQAEPATPSGSHPVEPDTPQAERRQLTVVFCDLVGSTSLSGQLDPEDLREVVRAYQQTAAEVINRLEGHIAQYLGDGLLVYFGYPRAHEDDARRAVRAGLEIIEAMETLNTRLEPDKGVRLAVRLGIHTGLVVVGEMGGGDRHEQLALGETPNVASRIQGLAEPDTVVISAATAHLVQSAFTLEELGTRSFKGVTEPMAVSRVLGLLEAQGDKEESTPAGAPFLVGRDEEIGLLRRRFLDKLE